MTSAFRPCAVIPTFDNPRTIRGVVERLRAYLTDILVVDDGSGPEARRVLERIAQDGLALVIHRPVRGGKGAAVKAGFLEAQARGFTHALQIDADGQHTIEDVPRLLDAARAAPQALVLGAPRFDATAPKVRIRGRRFNMLWTRLEVGPGVVEDSLCGFRVYPVAAALAANARSNAMDFDPEIPVRMIWAGTPVVNVPTKVRYFSEAEGHVSHFRMFKDNVLIVSMHTRLVVERLAQVLTGARKPLVS